MVRVCGLIAPHFTDKGIMKHVLVDEDGLVEIRKNFPTAMPGPFHTFMNPILGLPIYVDQCPCMEVGREVSEASV